MNLAILFSILEQQMHNSNKQKVKNQTVTTDQQGVPQVTRVQAEGKE
jgi:hypothetical protein